MRRRWAVLGLGAAILLGAFLISPRPYVSPLPGLLQSKAAFYNRFHAGVGEGELRKWLTENNFTLENRDFDPQYNRGAARLYPTEASWTSWNSCPTLAAVRWAVDAQGALASVELITLGQGCL